MKLHPNCAIERAAVELHGLVTKHAQGEYIPVLPTPCWQMIERMVLKRQKAFVRDWHRAALRLTNQLAGNLAYLNQQVKQNLTTMRQRADVRPIPSVRELYNELRDVARELGNVYWRSATDEAVATTEPIRLDGIDLGPFEIRLGLDGAGAKWCYRAVALEPQPAALDKGITHPHVRDGLICAGYAGTPMRAALAQHRFFDFFAVAAQILRTYTPGAAHVRIDQWHFMDCYDCALRTDLANLTGCSQCTVRLCSRCVRRCGVCDSILCSRCGRACSLCGEGRCEGCFQSCPTCRRIVCAHCMAGRRCITCSL